MAAGGFGWDLFVGVPGVVGREDGGTGGGCSEKGGEHVEVGESELVLDDLGACYP